MVGERGKVRRACPTPTLTARQSEWKAICIIPLSVRFERRTRFPFFAITAGEACGCLITAAKDLRVADTSVKSRRRSGNGNLLVVTVGEEISDVIWRVLGIPRRSLGRTPQQTATNRRYGQLG